MDSPFDRYNHDSAFKRLVDMMYSLIANADYSPSEIRQAAIMACTRREMYRIKDILAPEGEYLGVVHDLRALEDRIDRAGRKEQL